MYILIPTIDTTTPTKHVTSNVIPMDSVFVSSIVIRSRFSPFAKKSSDDK